MEFFSKLLYFLLLFSFFFFIRILFLLWLAPFLKRKRLGYSGFNGPSPKFPLGNLMEIYEKSDVVQIANNSNVISHNIHSSVFPYFAKWRKTYGKVFIYWLGTEPFLYVADPDFLKKISSGILAKKWGKPDVFKNDRKPMFGNGLVMVDGDNWVHNRHIIAPAFSTNNLNVKFSMMVDSTTKMLNKWTQIISKHEINVEEHIIQNAAEIIAKTSFGISQENGKKVFEKLQSMQKMLFKSNRLVGVPFNKFFSPKKSYKSWILGKEIDNLLLEIIEIRRKEDLGEQDLLGILLERKKEKLSSREIVDECKTFFFGGHETTALAIVWTLLLLAAYPEWQIVLREEIMEVSGGDELSPSMLSKLTKMVWVLYEVLRLYSPAPNVQRQAKEEIVIEEVTVPKGTNMWIDVVGMHHDPDLWGDDVNEFKPERFKDSINGGCKHRMGFMPFGFGGRVCIGRNLTLMEYKIVLSLILCKFSISISPTYVHSPRIMLSLRPSQGVPLILSPLE